MSNEFDRIEIRTARRRFLQGAAALATTLVAPGILLYKPVRASVGAGQRWGLLIDTNALNESDVDACVAACQREHGWSAERTAIQFVVDDTPFIVDSITGELNRRELTVHLAMHPQMSVRRDAEGCLLYTSDAADE